MTQHKVGGLYFEARDERFFMTSAFGLALAEAGNPLREAGLYELWLDDERINTDQLPAQVLDMGGALRVEWTPRDGVTLRADFRAAETGVVSWKSLVVNCSDKPIVIRRAMSRFGFDTGEYSLYAQGSGWCHENRGSWRRFDAGEMAVYGKWGRTTASSAPFCAVRDEASGLCTAFHLLPKGDWRISFDENLNFDTVALRLGASDELALTIHPGESWALPETLCYAASGIDLSAHRIHAYFNKNILASNKREPKVVYNTWFYEFPVLDVPRLRLQLQAAKDIGCEVFTIDAGWFGLTTKEDWADQGDWREKTEYAFRGHMRDFGDEVRTAGLDFGIWMEAEQALAHTPVCREHPEWFADCGDGVRRWKLEREDAYAYLRTEMIRVIEAYGLKWIKIDSNLKLNPYLTGLDEYFNAWYQLLDELRAAYPDLFIEGCSSGAMRFDLNTLSHYDAHFLSDNVNPYDCVRMSQGAMLRLPPGQIERWATIRAARNLPQYPLPITESPARTLVPEGAMWNRATTMDLSFPLTLSAMGIMGFSGDLYELSEVQKSLCCEAVTFFKAHRAMIRLSDGYLLTPEADFEHRAAWVAFQLSLGDRHLVYAYRMNASASRFTIVPRALKPQTRYAVGRAFPNPAPIGVYTGRELMGGLLRVMHAQLDEAAIYEMTETEA